MRISLVIPCYNAGPALEAVLAGVARQSRLPDEVLVVDDGSSDGSAARARRLGATVLTHDRNRGLAAARNTALSHASGEVVVFVDSDAVPHPELVARLSAGYADLTLAGVGGQIVELAPGALPDRWRALFWRQTLGPEPLSRAPFVVGACCSLRREAALAAGGFAHAFRTNGEDVELSLRLRARGLRLAYDPRAQVFHLRRDTLHSLLAMITRHSRDQVRALRLHHQSPAPVLKSALRWGPVTLLSSLRRHSSPALALLSPLCHGAALYGCAAGLLASTGRKRT